LTRPSHSSRTLELSKKDRGKRLYAEEKPKRIKSNNTGIDCSFHLVVLALHEQFGVREGCVMACMVKVEMRTNEQINLAGVQLSSKICSINSVPHDRGRQSRRELDALGQTAINQHVGPVAGLLVNKVKSVHSTQSMSTGDTSSGPCGS